LIEDIEASVYSRLPVLCHVWPGITPMNVWGMTYDAWLIFADAVDAWVAEQKEASK